MYDIQMEHLKSNVKMGYLGRLGYIFLRVHTFSIFVSSPLRLLVFLCVHVSSLFTYHLLLYISSYIPLLLSSSNQVIKRLLFSLSSSSCSLLHMVLEQGVVSSIAAASICVSNRHPLPRLMPPSILGALLLSID